VTGLDRIPYPQVTAHLGPIGPLPTIFFVQGEDGLYRTDFSAEGDWTPPEPQSGPGWGFAFAGEEFDVTADATGGFAVLALGLQPTCPCNRIGFATCDAAGLWSAPEDLTVHTDAYDWPFSPRLAVDRSGRIHAFWYQLGSDPLLNPHSTRLYHRVLDSDAWTAIDEGLPAPDERGVREPVALDARGRLVANLAVRGDGRGRWRAHWEGRDRSGGNAASGTYFARVRGADGRVSVAKIVLAR